MTLEYKFKKNSMNKKYVIYSNQITIVTKYNMILESCSIFHR